MPLAVVLVALLALFAVMLSGCGCEDKKYPEDLVDRFESHGVDLVGEHDSFGVQVKYIQAGQVDDGLFGGSHEEPTFTLRCVPGPSGTYEGEFESGESVDYKPSALFLPSDDKCFYESVGDLAVTCPKGSKVRIYISEDDTFSSSETGSVEIPAETLAFAYHGMWMSFTITLASTGSWDGFWNGALEAVGGICLTDFLPGLGKAARALKLSRKAVSLIRKANKNVKRYERAQAKLERCEEVEEKHGSELEVCGNAKSVMEALWGVQCVEANPGGGTYRITIQVSRSTTAFLSIGVMVVWSAAL